MGECGVATMSEEGLAIAIMAWQGVQLSWRNIIYEHMKLEMMKKHGRSSITFYSIPYITYLTSSSRQDHAPGPNVSTINSCTVVQSELTPGNPPVQAHLIQVGHWSDIPGPFRPKKRKQALPNVEAEEAEVFEIPPYRFNNVPSTLLQQDAYWRSYVKVEPEETLRLFEQAAMVDDIGARLQATAIREREARCMILEGLKREAQHKKEIVELKISLSNLTKLNETISQEQGKVNYTLQSQHEKLKTSFQKLMEEHEKFVRLHATLNEQLAEASSRVDLVEVVPSQPVEDDCIRELQSQVDVLRSEQTAFEERLKGQDTLQMENDSLKRHKEHVLALLKGDEDRKAQNQNLQSQVEELLSEKAELQWQHQTIEAGLKADLERASNKMKMVPVNRDP